MIRQDSRSLTSGTTNTLSRNSTGRITWVYVPGADGWTLRTHNRALSAHHEHTLMIRRDQAPLVLTALAT